MIRFLVSLALSLALLSGSASAQVPSGQTAVKFAFHTVSVLADVQGVLGGAVDTGYLDTQGCRVVAWIAKNTGTASSGTPQLWGKWNGISFGETVPYFTGSAIVAGGASGNPAAMGQPAVGLGSMFSQVRVTFPAAANATVRVLLLCLK